jgi:hypothetical protein
MYIEAPWKIDKYLGSRSDEWTICAERDGKSGIPIIESIFGISNARRIVACVNACKGIETGILLQEGSIAEIIKGKRSRIEELEGKVVKCWSRAEALANALKPFADIGNSIPSDGEFGFTIIFSDYKNAAEAIAKYQEDD